MRNPSAALARLGLVTLIGTSIAVGGASPALAAPSTITVCASGCDFTTIQPALDAAATGDTVSVAAGDYYGGVSIDTPGITLAGAGQDITTIHSDAAYSNTNRGISLLNVGDLTIHDLTVDGGADATFHDGIWWKGGATEADISGDGTTVERVTVRNIDRRAISVYPRFMTNTRLHEVTVDNVTATHSGSTVGGLAIVFNSAGSVTDSVVTRATAGITGTASAGAAYPVTATGNHVSALTGKGPHFHNVGISFNTTPSIAPVFTITNNTVRADVERNGGIYLVAPGHGSVIADNLLVLEGDLGYGIEAGWNVGKTLTIEHNTIVSGKGALGILATASGGVDAPLIVRDNTLRNISIDGAQPTDLRNWGINTGREAGIVISADEHTSRSGDAFGSTVALLTGNDVGGYTHALAFVSNDTTPATRSLAAAASGNALRATGTTAVHVLAEGTTATPVAQSPVAENAANYAPVDVRGNYWSTNAPQFDTLLSGWFTSGSPVIEAPPIAADSDALDTLIEQLNIDPDGGLDLFEPSGAGTANPPSAFDASKPLVGTLTWSSDDQSVDVFAFSTPAFVGRLPVVDGAVQIEGLDLSMLTAGNHRLVFVGSDSGEIVILPLTVAAAAAPELADTGAADAGLATGLAAAMLAGGALLLMRRRATRG